MITMIRRLPVGLGTPVVIGHRGASGYLPEHTLAAYRLAIRLGADSVEPDLVPTRDGVLVARHENEISATTDVALHPEFASRWTTKRIHGEDVSGWFTEDFDLAELKRLRTTERLPRDRPASAGHGGLHEVATLDEILALVTEESRRARRRVGVHAEIKHSSYFRALGLPIEEPLLAALRRHGLDRRGAPVAIQSFETANLRWLATRTDLSLVQLVEAAGSPADLEASGDDMTYADLVTPAGLRQVASYAAGVGVHKDLVLPRNAGTGATGTASALVSDAHRAGLRITVWTLRSENRFLATNFRRGADPSAHGDAGAEATAFFEAGVDGVFSDQVDTTVRARREWLRSSARAS